MCVFLSTRHSLFSLDFIACFFLVILCLVAIPTEMSASSHLLNGWLWIWIWIIVAMSRRLSQLAMFYHTLSQVVSPSVIKTLKIGTTDLEVPGRHSVCTDIVVVLCRWLILCIVWYFDAWDSVDVLYNVDELMQYIVFVSTGYTLYLETVNMSRWNFLAGYPVAREQGGQQDICWKRVIHRWRFGSDPDHDLIDTDWSKSPDHRMTLLSATFDTQRTECSLRQSES